MYKDGDTEKVVNTETVREEKRKERKTERVREGCIREEENETLTERNSERERNTKRGIHRERGRK